MKLDFDIKMMSVSERGRLIQRMREHIRKHKKRGHEAAILESDLKLYDGTLPEGAVGCPRAVMPTELIERIEEATLSLQRRDRKPGAR